MNSSNSDQDSAEFVRLLTENQRNLFTYIHALLLNRQDVEEVLQQTNLVLWRESNKFEVGTNFRAWSCTIALNQVRAFIKRRKRYPALFDDDTLSAIARRRCENIRYLDRRVEALSNCISRLSNRKKQLLNQRYGLELSVDEIAQDVGLSPAGVYKMLSRIRQALHACVSQTLSVED